MSNASQRALASMHRERERRLRLTGEGEMGIGQLVTTGEPGWDAFFGALHDKETAARAAGMGFRADLGGIGRWAEQDPGLVGGVNPLERTSLKYQAMQRQGDADVARAKLEMAGQDALVNARRDALSDSRIADLRAADDERKLAEAFRTPARGDITTESIGPDGQLKSVTMRPTRPETDRERMRAMLPPGLRPQFEKQWAAEDAAAKKLDIEDRKQKASESALADALVPDEAIEGLARNYLQTGKMPTLGMGDKTTRQRILSRAFQLDPSANVAGNVADYETDKASLKKLQVQRDAIGAFEETAKKNMDVFLKTAEKVADTGSPLLNQPVRLLSGKVLGSEDQAAYDAARAVLLPEIARIITNPNLTGVLSDSARHEVSSFNPESATLAQTIKVMKLLKQDMGNRITSLDEAIATVRGRMDKGGAKDDKPKETPEERFKRLSQAK